MRAARYVTNRYHNTRSITSMLDHLSWETLESRRTKAQLTMLFKITNNLVDIQADQHLIPTQGNTRSCHSMKFRQPSTSTSYYRNSFFPRTITIWTNLPSDVAEASDLVSFKQRLSPLSYQVLGVQQQVLTNDSQSCADRGHRNQIVLGCRDEHAAGQTFSIISTLSTINPLLSYHFISFFKT